MIKPLTTHTALTKAIRLSQAALDAIREGDSETAAASKLQAAGIEIGIRWDFQEGRCEITTYHQIDPL